MSHSTRQLRLAGLLDLERTGVAHRLANRSEVRQYWSWQIQLSQGKSRTVHVGSVNGFRIGPVVSNSRSGQGGPLDRELCQRGELALRAGDVKPSDIPGNRRRAYGRRNATAGSPQHLRLGT